MDFINSLNQTYVCQNCVNAFLINNPLYIFNWFYIISIIFICDFYKELLYYKLQKYIDIKILDMGKFFFSFLMTMTITIAFIILWIL